MKGERAAVYPPDVHASLVVAGCEGIKCSQWTGKIQPEVACEVVERARGHHHEEQVALHGRPGHRRHGPVTAGHRERLRAVIRRFESCVPRVLTGLQQAHPDPAFASCPGQTLR